MTIRRYKRNALAWTVLLLGFICCLAYPFVTSSPFVAHAQNANMNHADRAAQAQQQFIGGPYTLQATEIDGENAHLQLLPNALYPTLSFSSATIYGLNLSHPETSTTSLVITSPGPATSTGVAIKTSTFQDLKTALGRISPADLLILTLGGTVPHLVLKNVGMKIDVSLTAQYISLPSAQIQVASY